MFRRLIFTLCSLLLTASIASAQISISAIEVRDAETDELLLSSAQSNTTGTTGTATSTGLTAAGREFFNKARCECGSEVEIRVRLIPSTGTTTSDKLFLVAGAGDCIDNTNGSVDAACPTLYDALISEIREDIRLTVPVNDLMGECTSNQERNIYVFTGQESSVQQTAVAAYSVDGTAPTAPSKKGDPIAGEGFVELDFTAGSTTESEVKYQILCMRVENGEPGLTNPPGAGYSAATAICPTKEPVSDTGATEVTDAGVPLDGGTAPLPDGMADGASGGGRPAADDGGSDGTNDDAAASDASTSDGGDGPVTDGPPMESGPGADSSPRESGTETSVQNPKGAAAIAALDPRYVCSGSGSGASAKVEGLEDGVAYQFYVVAIDRYRNPSQAVDLGQATPALAEDLWERYKRAGGTAQSGFCTIGGDASLPVALLVLLGLFAISRRWGRGGTR